MIVVIVVDRDKQQQQQRQRQRQRQTGPPAQHTSLRVSMEYSVEASPVLQVNPSVDQTDEFHTVAESSLTWSSKFAVFFVHKEANG
eukprot:scaffold1493_cov172-Ochromonas_danica.AAC.16